MHVVNITHSKTRATSTRSGTV